MFPVSNCRLTSISQPGAVDAYGEPARTDPVWRGSVAGYLKRERRLQPTTVRTNTAARAIQTITKTDVLWLLASDGAPIMQKAGPDWEGSEVTVIDERGAPVERTFRVSGMENRVGGTAVDNLRLELSSPAGGASSG